MKINKDSPTSYRDGSFVLDIGMILFVVFWIGVLLLVIGSVVTGEL